MSNARVQRMIRELKTDSPRTLMDWLFGTPDIEQPKPAATVEAAAAEPQPAAAAEPVALPRAA